MIKEQTNQLLSWGFDEYEGNKWRGTFDNVSIKWSPELDFGAYRIDDELYSLLSWNELENLMEQILS